MYREAYQILKFNINLFLHLCMGFMKIFVFCHSVLLLFILTSNGSVSFEQIIENLCKRLIFRLVSTFLIIRLA